MNARMRRAVSSQSRQGSVRFHRLPPGAPEFVHVKHASSVILGPVSNLHRARVPWLASPSAAIPAAALAFVAATSATRAFFAAVGVVHRH